ncbi:hypothetical protein OE88DRAFT_1659592 [Heliocybe sulcata]|uniref:Protein kinase domain-containing protein n=1 Tax=Heliocybe sulcata TaxID=5364 RepID=A0A5C3NCC3_9AGAM|nr:hypothetical protein OE88DRAFT_1659592 [Heliocybe sulcata]
MSLAWDVPYPPRNLSEINALMKVWYKHCDAALDSPIMAGHTLQFIGVPTFDFLPSSLYNVTCASYLGQPLAPVNDMTSDAYHHGPRREYFETLRLDSQSMPDFKVVLTEPLSTGRGKYSQVWKAEAIGAEGDALPVVVKLFQGSLFPEPKMIGQKLDPETLMQEEVSHREAWAYERLRPAQGTIVPYSYGFYNVKLPCNDVVCAHIMEYIQGTSLGTYAATYGGHENQEETEKVMTTMTKVAYALHVLGVAHCDWSWRNIRVSPHGRVVIFDFGMAMNVEDPSENTLPPLVMDGRLLWACFYYVAIPRQVARWSVKMQEDPTVLWARPMRDVDRLSYDEWITPNYTWADRVRGEIIRSEH